MVIVALLSVCGLFYTHVLNALADPADVLKCQWLPTQFNVL